MCNITDTLRSLLDPSDPNDRKLLLLAELIQTRFSDLKEDIKELKESDRKITEHMENISEELRVVQDERKLCPIARNSSANEFIGFFLKYPKFIVICLLCIGFSVGTFGMDILTKILSLIF